MSPVVNGPGYAPGPMQKVAPSPCAGVGHVSPELLPEVPSAVPLLAPLERSYRREWAPPIRLRLQSASYSPRVEFCLQKNNRAVPSRLKPALELVGILRDIFRKLHACRKNFDPLRISFRERPRRYHLLGSPSFGRGPSAGRSNSIGHRMCSTVMRTFAPPSPLTSLVNASCA